MDLNGSELITALLFIFCVTFQLLPIRRFFFTFMDINRAFLPEEWSAEGEVIRSDPFTTRSLAGSLPSLLVLESSYCLSPGAPEEGVRITTGMPTGPANHLKESARSTQVGLMGCDCLDKVQGTAILSPNIRGCMQMQTSPDRCWLQRCVQFVKSHPVIHSDICTLGMYIRLHKKIILNGLRARFSRDQRHKDKTARCCNQGGVQSHHLNRYSVKLGFTVPPVLGYRWAGRVKNLG